MNKDRYKESEEMLHKKRQLIESVKRLIRDANTDKQEESVARFFDTLPNSKYSVDFVEHISNPDYFIRAAQGLEQAYCDRDVERLHQRLITGKKSSRRLARMFVTSGVAAVMLLCSFLLFKRSNDTVEPMLTQVEMPKYIVPTLVLEGDEEIILKDERKVVKVTDYAVLTAAKRNNVGMNQRLIVPQGHTYTVVLADGSEVTLNSCSELFYTTNFNSDERLVELKGEGYFKVTKETRPFIVSCNGASVRVYGTEFNVKSTRSNKLETVLISGSVGVVVGCIDEVKLVPNQMIAYDYNSLKLEIKYVNADDYTQWRNGDFNYKNYPLVDVLSDLSAWYGFRFELPDGLKDMQVTFFSSKDESIIKIFEVLELITHVKFINRGGGVYEVKQ